MPHLRIAVALDAERHQRFVSNQSANVLLAVPIVVIVTLNVVFTGTGASGMITSEMVTAAASVGVGLALRQSARRRTRSRAPSQAAERNSSSCSWQPLSGDKWQTHVQSRQGSRKQAGMLNMKSIEHEHSPATRVTVAHQHFGALFNSACGLESRFPRRRPWASRSVGRRRGLVVRQPERVKPRRKDCDGGGRQAHDQTARLPKRWPRLGG